MEPINNESEKETSLENFLGKCCTIVLPQGQTITGVLQTDGTMFGFNNGAGFSKDQVKSIFKIEASETVNLVRAVIRF